MQVQLLTKNDPLTRTLTATKRAYLTAKVAKELTDKQVDKETKPLWDAMDKEMDGENRDEILNPHKRPNQRNRKQVSQTRTIRLFSQSRELIT